MFIQKALRVDLIFAQTENKKITGENQIAKAIHVHGGCFLEYRYFSFHQTWCNILSLHFCGCFQEESLPGKENRDIRTRRPTSFCHKNYFSVLLKMEFILSEIEKYFQISVYGN